MPDGVHSGREGSWRLARVLEGPFARRARWCRFRQGFAAECVRGLATQSREFRTSAVELRKCAHSVAVDCYDARVITRNVVPAPGRQPLLKPTTGPWLQNQYVRGARTGVCLKGRALWGQTQGGYKAVGARCKIGWGAVTGGWNRVGVALGLQTCLRVELKEEPWGGGGPPPFKQSPEPAVSLSPSDAFCRARTIRTQAFCRRSRVALPNGAAVRNG